MQQPSVLHPCSYALWTGLLAQQLLDQWLLLLSMPATQQSVVRASLQAFRPLTGGERCRQECTLPASERMGVGTEVAFHTHSGRRPRMLQLWGAKKP